MIRMMALLIRPPSPTVAVHRAIPRQRGAERIAATATASRVTPTHALRMVPPNRDDA